jgi:hypothetical protein
MVKEEETDESRFAAGVGHPDGFRAQGTDPEPGCRWARRRISGGSGGGTGRTTTVEQAGRGAYGSVSCAQPSIYEPRAGPHVDEPTIKCKGYESNVMDYTVASVLNHAFP